MTKKSPPDWFSLDNYKPELMTPDDWFHQLKIRAQALEIFEIFKNKNSEINADAHWQALLSAREEPPQLEEIKEVFIGSREDDLGQEIIELCIHPHAPTSAVLIELETYLSEKRQEAGVPLSVTLRQKPKWPKFDPEKWLKSIKQHNFLAVFDLKLYELLYDDHYSQNDIAAWVYPQRYETDPETAKKFARDGLNKIWNKALGEYPLFGYFLGQK